jgi:Domain of unknown function (DUF4783)
MKKSFLISFVFLLLSFTSNAENIPPELITAFRTGDATKLAAYFNNSVELTLFDKEEIYSKTQAEMIMRDFFKQHIPTQFKILHQGGKDNSKYAIGNLICGSVSYRITFLLKIEDGNLYIHQLRIENNYVE